MELNPIIIGIAGGTGSGKSTLAENIEKEFKHNITMISHDYYYKSNSELPLEERKKLNYDHPDAFETDLLIEHLNKLKNGESIERPRDMMDIKIFVDADADIRFIRRLLRDVKERGRTLDSVVEQYCTTVKPMHEQFVEPSKKYADIIVPEGGYNQVALNMIVEKIRSII